MTSFIAVIKKEWMEVSRSGRLIILLLVFLLFGIMNPGIAKMTPWLMETMSESLKEQGLVFDKVQVNAITSWEQFYKNIPIGLIVFVLMSGGIFTAEYQKGTLIPVVAKGLARWKIVMAKTTLLLLLWTVCYWFSFGVTYFYNDYFWDNSIALHCIFAAVCYWLFGIWVVTCVVLFSTMARGNSGVLLGTGGVVVALNLISMLPKVSEYLPTKLMEGLSIVKGEAVPADYKTALIITMVTALLGYVAAVSIFNRKRI